MMSPTHSVTPDGDKRASKKRPRASTVTIPVLVISVQYTNATTGRAACATCHQRKIKCDAQNVGFPCTNCRKHFRSDCVWHQKRRRTLVRSPHHFVQIRQATLVSECQSSPDPLVELEVLQESQASPMYDHTDVLERCDDIGSLVRDGAQGCKRHLVEFIDQEDLSYRPIDKAARIAYVGNSFP